MNKLTQQERQMAALSYVWLFSVIILVGRKKSVYIQHHARRATALFVLSIVIWPFNLLHWVEYLVLAGMVMGFLSAMMGENFNVPYLNELADGKWERPKLKKDEKDDVIEAQKNRIEELEQKISKINSGS